MLTDARDLEDGVVAIRVARVRAVCDPLENPWYGAPIFEAEIAEAIAAGRLNAELFSRDEKGTARNEPWVREQHIERIAWLVVHGWTDPIQIDVGVPSLGCWVKWPVVDGNHRLAAAIFRRDEHIQADLSGCLRHAQELFGDEAVGAGYTHT